MERDGRESDNVADDVQYMPYSIHIRIQIQKYVYEDMDWIWTDTGLCVLLFRCHAYKCEIELHKHMHSIYCLSVCWCFRCKTIDAKETDECSINY